MKKVVYSIRKIRNSNEKLSGLGFINDEGTLFCKCVSKNGKQYTRAFLEVRCFDDFEERVKSRGDRWDDDINLWSGYDWEDYGKEMLDCCGYNIPDHILDFIDLERYGRYCGEEYLQEYSNGLIEI